MVDQLDDDAPRRRSVSKLSLLISFIAGAFAAWIIITAQQYVVPDKVENAIETSPIVPTRKVVRMTTPAAPEPTKKVATAP